MNTLLKKAGIGEPLDDHKDDNYGGDSGKQVSFFKQQLVPCKVFHQKVR